MKGPFLAALCLLAVACGAPETEAEVDDTAQLTGALTAPQVKCKTYAAARVPAWKAAGVPQAEIDRRTNLAMVACADAAIDSPSAVFIGAVNTDLQRLALQLTAQTLTPEQYIHRMRDRARKARKARADKTWPADWLAGDDDHDLVANKRDMCPATPDLDPTEDDGCPAKLVKLATVPNAERVQQLFAKFGVARSRACDGAPVPEVPTRVSHAMSPAGNQTLMLIVPRVRNQPADCLVFYELEAFERERNVIGRAPLTAGQRIVLRATEGWADPTNRVFQFPVGGTGPKEQLRAKAAAGWETRIRVRALNANGQASAWSPVSD